MVDVVVEEDPGGEVLDGGSGGGVVEGEVIVGFCDLRVDEVASSPTDPEAHAPTIKPASNDRSTARPTFGEPRCQPPLLALARQRP